MRLDITAAVIALIIWLGGGSWYWTCKVKGHCDGNKTAQAAQPESDPLPEPEASPEALQGFSVDQDGLAMFRRNDPLTSKLGLSNLLVTPSVQQALDSLGSFLNNQQDMFLEVTGRYLPNVETESSTLALERARGLGQLLIQKGLDAGRLIYSYGEAPSSLRPDSLLSAVSLHLIQGESEEPEAALFEPQNLYFDFGKTDLPITPEFRAYCSSVIRYLRAHPNAMLSVTGHTDNKGSATRNREVGMGRATRVAEILSSFGVNEAQLRISSEGMESPIASNDTEEGRAQNRRVEIRLGR